MTTNEIAPRASVHGIEQIDGGLAAGIGLHYGKAVALIYVTDADGAKHTLISEPDYARLMQAASQDGELTLDAGSYTPIPLIRQGWPDDWQTPDDVTAWHAWIPEA
ncbi:hypothetical protein [Arthrobacter sp. FW306-04-A]|uniref:hypothetical protein n=1 Tax=Arthrobacter sp. FW306-04-A TaxID=2879619 RepID=UPI0037BEA9EF|nr:hypothetical protein LFT43_12365 [Arthrobacter sp. FW306-04-A]